MSRADARAHAGRGADIYNPAKRSEIMGRVRATDTKPELEVRKVTHGLGYRFRLHGDRLPGRPDLVFPRHRKVIFVHGCFWHGHDRCSKAAIPVTNREFWERKLTRNRERDQENITALATAGWRSLVIWECETKDRERLAAVVHDFLDAGG